MILHRNRGRRRDYIYGATQVLIIFLLSDIRGAKDPQHSQLFGQNNLLTNHYRSGQYPHSSLDPSSAPLAAFVAIDGIHLTRTALSTMPNL